LVKPGTLRFGGSWQERGSYDERGADRNTRVHAASNELAAFWFTLRTHLSWA
jgi:hypothetical protein